MKAIVFVGPSINGNIDEIKNDYPEIIFYPPLKHAELLSIIEMEKPEVIGIIDDYTGFTESPWHSEILYTLKRGIKIFGAASQGAIRALEFNNMGMIGVGKIYQYYKDKSIISDDEVLCVFDNKNFKKLTVPYINFLLSSINKDILKIIQKIHWKERTFKKIYEELRENGFSDEDFKEIKERYIDFQKLDTILLLKKIKEFKSKSKYKKIKLKRIKEDNPLKIMYERDRIIKNNKGRTTLNDLANFTIFHHPNSSELLFNSLNREIVAFFAKYLNIQLSKDEINNEIERFKRERNIKNEQQYQRWLEENDINESIFMELIERLAYCRKMHKWFRIRRKYRRLTWPIIEELILKGEYEKFKNATIDFENFIQDNREEIVKIYKFENINKLLKQIGTLKLFPWNIHPFIGAEESGFSLTQFKMFLAKLKVYYKKLLCHKM